MLSNLERSFAAIAATGHKAPKLSIAGFTYKRAPDHGRNAGAVYVTDTEDRTYLGKIINGAFYSVLPVNMAARSLIASAVTNPQEEAIKWGRETGDCACCGRPLSNALSVALGIGPICNEKWGWTLPEDNEAI